MLAQDLMTADPVTVLPTESVYFALRTLRQLDVRHLPVVESGVLVGMVSDRDLRDASLPLMESIDQAEIARDQLAQSVSEVMRSGLVSVELNDDVDDVIELLVEHKIGAIPVLVDGTRELAGIISYIDILRAAQGNL